MTSQGFLAAEQSLFMPLLLLGATLAIAGGLPFLLLPASLIHTSNSGQARMLQAGADSRAAAAAVGGKAAAARGGAAVRTRRMRSPFSDAADGEGGSKAAAAGGSGGCGGWLPRLWGSVQGRCGVVGTRLVSVLVKTDAALRSACASSFLDTAVSGLIVVGLILGSVVLSAVLLVQIGDESRQVRLVVCLWLLRVCLWLGAVVTCMNAACGRPVAAMCAGVLWLCRWAAGALPESACTHRCAGCWRKVQMHLLADFLVLCNRPLLLLWRHPQAVVSVNMLVRQKGTEAGLTEGVWSLVQQYEGQLVGMTQYVLQETLPGLTHYVENRASDFLVSHNLSKVRAVVWRGVCGVSVVCGWV